MSLYLITLIVVELLCAERILLLTKLLAELTSMTEVCGVVYLLVHNKC